MNTLSAKLNYFSEPATSAYFRSILGWNPFPFAGRFKGL